MGTGQKDPSACSVVTNGVGPLASHVSVSANEVYSFLPPPSLRTRKVLTRGGG